MSLMLRIFTLCLFGAALTLHADLTPVIDFSLKKDGRQWREEIHDERPDRSIREYVLDKENTQNWTEMFTLQYFHDVPETPQKFFEDFIRHLKETIQPHQLTYKVISQDKNSLLGEWKIKEGGPIDQMELVRIMKQGEDLVLIHYVTKNVNMKKAIRSTWESILNEVKFDQVRYSRDDYSIVIPSDWEVKETKMGEGVKRSFENPNHTISLLDAEVFKIQTKSPEEFLKEASADENLWGEFDKYETLPLNNGTSVKTMIYKPRIKYRDYKTVTILYPIVVKDMLYLTSATFPAKDYKQDKQVVEKIVKSFQVKGKEAQK